MLSIIPQWRHILFFILEVYCSRWNNIGLLIKWFLIFFSGTSETRWLKNCAAHIILKSFLLYLRRIIFIYIKKMFSKKNEVPTFRN